MARLSHRPLSRDRAWSCISLNFSISGLGSLRAGRLIAGIGQLGFVLAGFFLLLDWMLKIIHHIFEAELGTATTIGAPGWLWKWGTICVGISWSWMLITCWSLMRQAKADEKRSRQNIPPKLSELPPKAPENPENNP